jgi:hypothetical protein
VKTSAITAPACAEADARAWFRAAVIDIRVVHRIVIHDDADPLETSGTQVAEDGCQVCFHSGEDLRQLSGDTRWVICALHPKQEHVVSPEADRDQPRIRVRLEEGDRKIQLRGSVANM